MSDVTARPNSLPWPPIIYLAAIVVSVLSNVFYPLPWFGQPLSGILFVLGWLMIAAFVALNISAIRAMRRAGTTVRPDRGTDHLVTDGPFSFTRNPLYVAGTMLVLGIGLVSGIVWFLLLAILAAFIGAKARHRAGGNASTSAIRGDLSGLFPSRAAMDLVSPCRWRCSKRLLASRRSRARSTTCFAMDRKRSER
jgi:protein-S-isoprenylcysteine O-methyltransferase Ste14